MYCKHNNVIGNCSLCDTDSNEREVLVPLIPKTDFEKVLFLESYIKYQKHKMDEQEKQMMQVLENFEIEVEKRVNQKMEQENIRKLMNQNANLEKENKNLREKMKNQSAELKMYHAKMRENKFK